MRSLAILACGVLAACSSAPGPGPAPAAGPAPAPAKDSGRYLGFRPLAATATAAGAAPDACARAAHPFSQPIAITDDARVPRWPPIAGAPIAFPRAADLRSLAGFGAVTMDGRALPAQLEVLSRWGDGPDACGAPIRWAYAWVPGEIEPGTRAYFSIVHRPGTEPAFTPRLAIDDDEDRVVVDTGPARFTVRKDWFNGLSKVELRSGGAWRTIAEVPSTDAAGMLVERDGKLATPLKGRRLGFELERAGPHVATVRASGTYAWKNGADVFRYTLRLHFYAGTGAVAIDHTYYNGRTTDISAHGGKERVITDRVFTRLPIVLGSDVEVLARSSRTTHRVLGAGVVAVQQDKRTPDRPAVVSSVTHGGKQLELGTFADQPMIAVAGGGAYVVATIGWMGTRDPQALRFDPATGALDLDWQSEALAIGGARGVWSKAVLDFGAAGADLELRGTQLHAHATRPLIGVPSVAYLNTTRAYGTLPEGELPSEYARFDRDVDRIHATTVEYLRKYRITGTQIWPDLPRTACRDRACLELEQGYFEGGDDNYWDWSLVELEAFLRTADPSFVHDFALAEAITMAETISFRPDAFTKSVASSFGGFSPCYGGARGDDGVWVEGLNHRRGTCPGDYSYNKVHRLAYLLTADRRFLDFFADGAETAIRMYKDPPKTKPDQWLELSASRTTYQYLEPLLTAAELGRRDNARYRDRAIAYLEHMLERALARGHTCNLLGSGRDDPRIEGRCESDQAWMLPVWIEWVGRLAELYGHDGARRWLLDFAEQSARLHTALDDGRPDIGEARGGWRTTYRCAADRGGIRDETCAKVTELENEGRFYPNGLLAYLNAFALVLDADPSDPRGLCAWLPGAYRVALREMDQTNDFVWGKELGQAYAMAQRALGALAYCEARE